MSQGLKPGSGLRSDVRAEARAYLRGNSLQVEKLEPQPQDLVEWGLMKLKPWRMRVSS